MAIEKLLEFAKDGQKNTDDLNLTDGFPVSKKPARQWFNWLFNTLTSKVNEIIDAEFIPKAEIVDNLTTNDANKVASARTVKELQDNKLDKTDLKDASTEQKGVVQVNNTLTSTATNQALTAAQGKVLNDQAFGVGQTRKNVTSSRFTNTDYVNATPKPMKILFLNKAQKLNFSAFLTIAGVEFLWSHAASSIGIADSIEFTLLPGESYSFSWKPEIIMEIS